MKLEFRHEPNADETFGCCARTEYQGKDYFGIGKTWEDADNNLLMKINSIVKAKVPPPTIVEVADDEMDGELLPWEDQFGNVTAQITGTRDIEAGKL